MFANILTSSRLYSSLLGTFYKPGRALFRMCLSVWRGSRAYLQTGPYLPTRHEPRSRQYRWGHSGKIRQKKLTTEYFTENTHKKNSKAFPPLSFCVSRHHRFICSPDRKQRHVAAPTEEHEISELCCRRKRSTVGRHPLTSAESHFSTSAVHLMTNLPPSKRLCEGYQGCLLNNHHVWKHHYETLTLCTALIKWLWLGRLNVRFGLIPEEGRKAEVLMDFGSLL